MGPKPRCDRGWLVLNGAQAKRTKLDTLEVACLGTAEIFGISMKRDLLLEEEELIWEWK